MNINKKCFHIHSYGFREGVEDIFYYSCQEHLDELIAVLREEEDEVDLLTVIEDRYEEIVRHMKVTEELYNEQKGDMNVLLYFL